jgi:aminoglycoside phosphotransferase (APT) family kinase protein
MHSYQVEAHWYQEFAHRCSSNCPVPGCLAVEALEHETVLVLTDLDAAGFDLRKERVTMQDMQACLNWLASFHATFLNSPVDGLWECGCYWHLDTRPDELAALDDNPLREAASAIDQALRRCRYQTIVHGDAKLANFCFTDNAANPGVAAVDFQYVGRGCGMKDVAYFVGSCLGESDCEALESPLLDFYFTRLGEYAARQHPGIDPAQLEADWRALYDVAWADFHRFLKGWSPGHWKINSYSERMTRRVIERLQR